MPADRKTITPPPGHASPIRIPGTSPSSKATLAAKVHGRARSTSGGSQASTSRAVAVAPFPTLLATADSLLEQNLYDVMWKTFVAFEQDMRDCSQLAPLLPGIEATVSSAVDPISLAGDCLADTATYIETDIRDAIEEALATGGTLLSSSPGSSRSDGGTRTILSCPVSYSKQFSLASTRISGCCSTFRATQASLRYYGGARKTAYQLDLFVHKFALPTSTALHKRGQEFSAANKWLKKMLNGDGRMLDSLELAALRRAGTAMKHWAEALRIHSDILRAAASNVRTLLQERLSLQAYSFPTRPMPLQHSQGGMMMASTVYSPMSQWTTINTQQYGTPSSVESGLPDLGSSFSPFTAPSSCFSTPENYHSQIMAPKGGYEPYGSSPVSHESSLQSLPQSQSLPLSSYPQSLPQSLPQPCGFAFATPTYNQDQSIYQQQAQQQHAQSQQQNSTSPQLLQQYQELRQAAYSSTGLMSPPVKSPDLSFPTELFFDNLCM